MDEYYSKRKYKKVESDTFAVLDFGSETTIVNFLKDRVLEFNKVILSGSSILTSILQGTQYKSSGAERLKKTYGMTPPTIFQKENM